MTAAVSLRYPASHLPSRPLRTTRDRNTTMCRMTHAPVSRHVGHLRRGHRATYTSTGHSRPAPKRAPTACDPVERACSVAEAPKQHPPLRSRGQPKPPSFPSRPDFAHHSPPRRFVSCAAGGAPSRTDPLARFHVRGQPDPPRDARRPRSACLFDARANSRVSETTVFPKRDRLRNRSSSGMFHRSETLDRISVVTHPKVRDTGDGLSDRSHRAAHCRLLHTRKRAFRGPSARTAFAVAHTCAPLCTSRNTRRCSSLTRDANATNSRLAHTRESKTPS
jgi:hypothetical protein